MTAAAIQLKEAGEATQHEAVLVQAWAKRRPKWTRTETARWLNERSAPLLAWLRRRAAVAPARHSEQLGYWVKEQAPDIFERAHVRLAEANNEERDVMHVEEVMR